MTDEFSKAYQSRYLPKAPKTETDLETAFTAILMIVAFALLAIIIYLLPLALK